MCAKACAATFKVTEDAKKSSRRIVMFYSKKKSPKEEEWGEAFFGLSIRCSDSVRIKLTWACLKSCVRHDKRMLHSVFFDLESLIFTSLRAKRATFIKYFLGHFCNLWNF